MNFLTWLPPPGYYYLSDAHTDAARIRCPASSKHQKRAWQVSISFLQQLLPEQSLTIYFSCMGPIISFIQPMIYRDVYTCFWLLRDRYGGTRASPGWLYQNSLQPTGSQALVDIIRDMWNETCIFQIIVKTAAGSGHSQRVTRTWPLSGTTFEHEHEKNRIDSNGDVCPRSGDNIARLRNMWKPVMT
jgi:hypothetical protein